MIILFPDFDNIAAEYIFFTVFFEARSTACLRQKTLSVNGFYPYKITNTVFSFWRIFEIQKLVVLRFFFVFSAYDSAVILKTVIMIGVRGRLG